MLLPVSDINPGNCGSWRETERARVPGSRGGVHHELNSSFRFDPSSDTGSSPSAFCAFLVGWLDVSGPVLSWARTEMLYLGE